MNVLRTPPGGPGIKGLGASGAVMGLMVAAAMIYGERMFLAFFVIPMKVKYFVANCLALDLLAKGEVDLTDLITHKFPFDQLEQAIKTAIDPNEKSLKVIVTRP